MSSYGKDPDGPCICPSPNCLVKRHVPLVPEVYKIKEVTLGVYHQNPEMPSVTFTHEEVVVLRYILQNARGANWPLAWDGPLVKRVIEKIGPTGLNSTVEEL